MSVPELREAATKLREFHTAQVPGYDDEFELAVAAWLDSEADRLAGLTHAIPSVVVSDGVLREWGFGHALDVARAYLGGAA